jgi:L-threonylcarbamoyladenylate synthase
MADLNGRIAGCVDGGPTGVGVESTVVDCSRYAPYVDGQPTPANGHVLTENDEPLVILRPGGVTKADLERVVGVGRVVTDLGIWAAKPAINPSAAVAAQSSSSSAITSEHSQTVTSDAPSSSGHHGPRAPGMKYTHYAPRAPVWIVDGSNTFFQRLIDDARTRGERVGVLATEERARQLTGDVVIPCGLLTDLNTVARKLYDCLRAFDDTNVTVIYSEQFAPPDDKGMGEAVMNRLDKAAGHRLVRETSTGALPSAAATTANTSSSSLHP